MAEDRKHGYFDGLEAQHRRRVLFWGGLIATLIAAAAAYALWRLPADETPKREPETSITPTATPEPTATPAPGESSSGGGEGESSGGTGTDGQGSDADAGGGTGSGEKPPAANAGWVAYELDGDVWVAKCDGADSRKVAPGTGAVSYEVSPDGRTLAIGRSDGLELRDVRSGKARRVTKVAAGGISWSADSKRLAFASGGELGKWEIRVVGADGSGHRSLGAGAHPRISPDGARVAFMSGGMGSGKPIAVVAASGGSARNVPSTAGTLDFDWADDETLVALVGTPATGAEPPSVTIRRVTLGGKTTDVFSSEVTAPIVTWMYLHASPDGKALLFAEVGDDGYSRAHVLGADRKLVDLGARRDTYPVGWSGDGKVLFIEGNSFQGEETDLMCAKPDGSGRRLVVSGASR